MLIKHVIVFAFFDDKSIWKDGATRIGILFPKTN